MLGSGTEPCRFAGELDRLPGALDEGGPGKAAESAALVAGEDAPLASAITMARAYPLAAQQSPHTAAPLRVAARHDH